MTPRAIGILAAVIAGLGLLLLVLESNRGGNRSVERTLLLPELETVAADLQGLTIHRSGDEGQIVLKREREQWVVATRDDYPADVSKIRQLVIAMTDARIVEEKTANPKQYAKLGVADPAGGGSGTLLTFAGADREVAVILGETAQGRYRYARRSQQPKSFLIDRNPPLPGSAGAWLRPDILDLAASEVRRVTIEHADGESIVIEKSAEDQTDFTVRNIPEGRELTYATAANPIGAALAGLDLEEVRQAADGTAASTAAFETWDGLTIAVAAVSEEEHTWLTFSASAEQAEEAAENAAGTAPASSTADRAAALNDRLSGWQYRVASPKKDLFTRRWDELLKPAE